MDGKKMIRQSVFVALAALAGCSSMKSATNANSTSGQTTADVALRSSSDVPAAQGRLVVKAPQGSNQVVGIGVAHMAPASKVKAGAEVYVVWLSPDGSQQPINMGVLSVDKDLKGQLEFKTPFQKFDVFITAESSATVQAPADHKLLTASVDLPGHAIR